jgi:hypothetical protein
MSKHMIALVSLIIGVSFGWFMGIHESTIVSPVLAQGIELPNAIPAVPSLHGITEENAHFGNERQQLDGLDCKNCRFDNASLEYSGGAFRLENATFAGPFRLTLKGAAANTAELLSTIPALANIAPGKGIRPKPSKPNEPLHKSIPFTNTIRGSVSSPFGQILDDKTRPSAGLSGLNCGSELVFPSPLR